jgi:hypothetical protein
MEVRKELVVEMVFLRSAVLKFSTLKKLKARVQF